MDSPEMKELRGQLAAAEARAEALVDKCDTLKKRVTHLELPDCNNCRGDGYFFNGSNNYSCNECGGTGKITPREPTG